MQNQRSEANNPKSKFPSRRSQAKDRKPKSQSRRPQAKDFKAEIPRRRSQVEDPTPKISSQSSQMKVQANDPKWKPQVNFRFQFPCELSRSKNHSTKDLNSSFPSDCSKARVPKRKIPSERFQAKVTKWTFPTESSQPVLLKRKHYSEDFNADESSQAKDLKRKLWSDNLQTKAFKLTQPSSTLKFPSQAKVVKLKLSQTEGMKPRFLSSGC